MLTKTLLSSVRSAYINNAGAICQAARLYHHDFKPPTLNEFPVPEGSWEEYNRKQQQKYNLHLAIGVGFTIFSIVMAKTSGLFFFNFSRPDKPAEITSY